MITLKEEPTLLIADDQPDNLRAIVDILQDSGQKYNFIKVPNGKLLAEVAAKKKPDLIITDWEMPEMSGIEAILELKKNPDTKDIPVIMCTGIMITAQNLKEALEAGAVDFVRKPVEAVELTARVQSMLKLSASFVQIKKQMEELEQLNILKNRLLSVVSHDVRTPLNSLKGIFYLFEKEALSPAEVKEIIGQLSIQVGQVTDFLENLLHWVRNQLNHTALNRTRFHLNSIVKHTIDLFLPIAESKKISFLSNLDTYASVEADEEMIKIVLRNLIGNAIKFCQEKDKIEVSIQVSPSKEFASISVKDSGLGISPENVAKLFGNQYLSTRGTNNEMGTGLGLLLCKQYIEINEGTIGVESEEGKGSHFWFSLPMKGK